MQTKEPITSPDDPRAAGLRVEVAKDVLEQLEGNDKFKAGSFYLTIPGAISMVADSKTMAAKVQKSCLVCAIGACFLSLVKLDNEFDWVEASNCHTNLYGSPGIHNMRRRLKQTFTATQLQAIESYFEHYDGHVVDENETPRLRMTRIMTNIVENNGTFTLAGDV